MASRDIKLCDSRLINIWDNAVPIWKRNNPGIEVFITCTLRSPKEQNALYAQGRTKPGNIVTNAKAYQSPHNFTPSQAIDVAFKNKDGTINWDIALFKGFAQIVKDIDSTIIWGGLWKSIKDYPHFETPDWRKMRG